MVRTSRATWERPTNHERVDCRTVQRETSVSGGLGPGAGSCVERCVEREADGMRTMECVR